MNPQPTVQATGRKLHVWLAVLQALSLLYLAVIALALLVPSIVSPASLPPGMAWAGFAVIMLCGALVALNLLLFGWVREWLGATRAWVVDGTSPDRARVSALRTTLNRWITFAQWAPVVSTVLVVVALLAAGSALIPLIMLSEGAELPDARMTSVLPGLWAGMTLIATLPSVIITFLIYRAIRTWMNAVTAHLLGFAQSPVTPAAQAVSQWFVACQVLVVIGALVQIPTALLGSFIPMDDRTPFLIFLPLAVGGTALTYLLLDWSRRFALGVATHADGSVSQTAAAYPA